VKQSSEICNSSPVRWWSHRGKRVASHDTAADNTKMEATGDENAVSRIVTDPRRAIAKESPENEVDAVDEFRRSLLARDDEVKDTFVRNDAVEDATGPMHVELSLAAANATSSEGEGPPSAASSTKEMEMEDAITIKESLVATESAEQKQPIAPGTIHIVPSFISENSDIIIPLGGDVQSAAAISGQGKVVPLHHEQSIEKNNFSVPQFRGSGRGHSPSNVASLTCSKDVTADDQSKSQHGCSWNNVTPDDVVGKGTDADTTAGSGKLLGTPSDARDHSTTSPHQGVRLDAKFQLCEEGDQSHGRINDATDLSPDPKTSGAQHSDGTDQLTRPTIEEQADGTNSTATDASSEPGLVSDDEVGSTELALEGFATEMGETETAPKMKLLDLFKRNSSDESETRPSPPRGVEIDRGNLRAYRYRKMTGQEEMGDAVAEDESPSVGRSSIASSSNAKSVTFNSILVTSFEDNPAEEANVDETIAGRNFVSASPIKSILRSNKESGSFPSSDVPSSASRAAASTSIRVNPGSLRKLFGALRRNGSKTKGEADSGTTAETSEEENADSNDKGAADLDNTTETMPAESVNNNDDDGNAKDNSNGIDASKDNSDEDAKHWRSTLDAGTNMTYYFNKKTKAVTWVKPPGFGNERGRENASDEHGGKNAKEMPGSRKRTRSKPSKEKRTKKAGCVSDGAADPEKEELVTHWRAALDTSTGEVYYFNKKTNMTTWARPEGFEERKSRDNEEKAGGKFNANTSTSTRPNSPSVASSKINSIIHDASEATSDDSCVDGKMVSIYPSDGSGEGPANDFGDDGADGIASSTIKVFGNIEAILVPTIIRSAKEKDDFADCGGDKMHDVNAAASSPMRVASVLSMFDDYILSTADDREDTSLDSRCSLLDEPPGPANVAQKTAHSPSAPSGPSPKKRRFGRPCGRNQSPTEANDVEPIVVEASVREWEAQVSEASDINTDTANSIEVTLGASRRIDTVVDHGLTQGANDVSSGTTILSTNEGWDRPVGHDDALPQNAACDYGTDKTEVHYASINTSDFKVTEVAIVSDNPIHWNGRIAGLRLPSNIDVSSNTKAKPTECRVDPSKFFVSVEGVGEKKPLGAEGWNPWEENTDNPIGNIDRAPYLADALDYNSTILPMSTIPPPTNIVLDIYLFNQNEPSKDAVKIQMVCDPNEDTSKILQQLQSSIQKFFSGKTRVKQLTKSEEGDPETRTDAFLWRKKGSGVSISAVHPSPYEDDAMDCNKFWKEFCNAINICSLFCGRENSKWDDGCAGVLEGYERVQNTHSLAIQELLRRATKEEFGKYAISLPIFPSNDSHAFLLMTLLLDSCPPTITSVSSSTSFHGARIFVSIQIVVEVSIIYATKAQITWFTDGEQVCADSSCYTPTTADVGKALTVVIAPLRTNHDGRGCEEAYQFDRLVEAFSSLPS